MKHTHNISGMTCDNCKASVEKYLLAIKDVNFLEINREKGTVEITMDKHLSIEELSAALPEKYTITESESIDKLEEKTENIAEKSKLQQLKPLLIILFYLVTASNLMHLYDWNMKDVMLDFMGLFYIVFSFFKLLDLKGFPDSFRMYDPLAKKLPIYGWIYPFIETALGLMLLFRFEVDIALIVTLIVLGITTFGVTKTLIDKKSIRCACLGTALNLPMTEATFIENSIMIVMAVVMLIS